MIGFKVKPDGRYIDDLRVNRINTLLATSQEAACNIALKHVDDFASSYFFGLKDDQKLDCDPFMKAISEKYNDSVRLLLDSHRVEMVPTVTLGYELITGIAKDICGTDRTVSRRTLSHAAASLLEVACNVDRPPPRPTAPTPSGDRASTPPRDERDPLDINPISAIQRAFASQGGDKMGLKNPPSGDRVSTPPRGERDPRMIDFANVFPSTALKQSKAESPPSALKQSKEYPINVLNAVKKAHDELMQAQGDKTVLKAAKNAPIEDVKVKVSPQFWDVFRSPG